MLLNARNNLFEFNFPKTFMPEEIINKYRKYLNKIPGSLIEEPLDYLNSGIQSITLPGFGYDPVNQLQSPGFNRQFRNTLQEQELLQKEFVVSFQMQDAFINYWMMLELMFYYYSFDTVEPFIDDLNIRMLDGEGNVIVTVQLHQVLFKNLDQITMSFSSNVAEFNTFDATFAYNNIDIKIELQ